ncbi:hypothetical protein ACLKA6_008936 [Drosophila palustris]
MVESKSGIQSHPIIHSHRQTENLKGGECRQFYVVSRNVGKRCGCNYAGWQENSFEPFKQTINIQEQVQTQSQTTTRRRPKNSTNGGLPSERFK